MPFKLLHSLLILFLFSITVKAQINEEIFEYDFKGKIIHGAINSPTEAPKGLVLIVQGSGCYAAVDNKLFYDVRQMFVESGYSTYVWDKMGCGNSEGTFNYNRTIQESVDEAIAGLKALKEQGIPGVDAIGLWGVSRAGWINPVLINQYPDIKFWISVSGVDGYESFGYLLEKNLRIGGMQEDSVQMIVEEWREGNRISHEGATFAEYMSATSNLWVNPFLKRFQPGEVTEERYLSNLQEFMKQPLDKESGLPIIVEDFEETLSSIDIPVLALFGELDMHVDWRKTKILYEETLKANGKLSIKTFPGCNHNMFKANTGGFYEFEDNDLPWDRCDGFLETMSEWLSELE